MLRNHHNISFHNRMTPVKDAFLVL